MKIGFDAKRAFSNRSGLGNYSRNILNALLQYYPEHTYYLFTPKSKQGLYSATKNQKLIEPQKAWQYFSSFWRSAHISSEVSKHNIELYHGLSHELPMGIEKSRAKSVVTIHDLIFLRYPNFYKKTDRIIYKKKFKQACMRADKIIAISQQTKQDIVSFFNIDAQKIDVVYQPINAQYFNKVLTNKTEEVRAKYALPEQFMLYVGTIEERKNLLSVVQALDIKKINYPLIVIGKPTLYKEKVKKYMTKAKLRNIVFLNNVSNNDLHAIYSMSKFVVYPSVFEGFGLPVVEAHACGTPVITSNLSSLPEAGGKAAVLINPNLPDEIGEAMLQLIGNEEFYELKKKQSVENANRFTYEKAAKNIFDIYNNLVGIES